MTEEELFKVYTKRELCAHCRFPQLCKGEDKCSNIATAKGHYLAGLEAGKSMAETDLAIVAYMQGGERYKLKWHKVADGDLPNNLRYVWTNVGAGYYDTADNCWRDDFGRLQGVIAWCEPKFEKEVFDNMLNEFRLSRDILGLWQQTVCKIRSEIKTQDTPALVYAKELCDKLECSMCALAGGNYSLWYDIEM